MDLMRIVTAVTDISILGFILICADMGKCHGREILPGKGHLSVGGNNDLDFVRYPGRSRKPEF